MLDTVAVEENKLVSQAQVGDQAAFGELVCSYHSRVINVVYRMCGDPALAEDAAQAAFLKAWQHLPQFRPGSSFRHWLYRIAVNAGLDLLRRERRQVDIEQASLASPGGTPETSLEHQERICQVRQAVLALPEASRAVLVLREYEGLSYREIAQVLDIPMGTVMSRLNYARSQLHNQLKDLLLN